MAASYTHLGLFAIRQLRGVQSQRGLRHLPTHRYKALLRCTYEHTQADHSCRKHAFNMASSSAAARKHLSPMYSGGSY